MTLFLKAGVYAAVLISSAVVAIVMGLWFAYIAGELWNWVSKRYGDIGEATICGLAFFVAVWGVCYLILLYAR